MLPQKLCLCFQSATVIGLTRIQDGLHRLATLHHSCPGPPELVSKHGYCLGRWRWPVNDVSASVEQVMIAPAPISQYAGYTPEAIRNKPGNGTAHMQQRAFGSAMLAPQGKGGTTANAIQVVRSLCCNGISEWSILHRSRIISRGAESMQDRKSFQQRCKAQA